MINYVCFEIVKSLSKFGMCYLEGGYESIIIPSFYMIRRWLLGLELVFFKKKTGDFYDYVVILKQKLKEGKSTPEEFERITVD
jgi:hypothetical protein